jgi:hypothetical protein
MVEVRLDRDDPTLAMQQMRLWLDARQIVPTRFTAAAVDGGFIVQTEFQIDAEAEAFAVRFAGRCYRR